MPFDMFSTTTIIVIIIVAAHFIIGIGLLVYKISSATKKAEQEGYNRDDWDETKCGDE